MISDHNFGTTLCITIDEKRPYRNMLMMNGSENCEVHNYVVDKTEISSPHLRSSKMNNMSLVHILLHLLGSWQK